MYRICNYHDDGSIKVPDVVARPVGKESLTFYFHKNGEAFYTTDVVIPWFCHILYPDVSLYLFEPISYLEDPSGIWVKFR